jgi:8-oxo-dGTP diphosphatase
VRVVHELVAGLVPFDDLETQHRADTLHWLEATDDVFRRAKPATPDRHLVSYTMVVDPADGSTLVTVTRTVGGPRPRATDCWAS